MTDTSHLEAFALPEPEPADELEHLAPMGAEQPHLAPIPVDNLDYLDPLPVAEPAGPGEQRLDRALGKLKGKLKQTALEKLGMLEDGALGHLMLGDYEGAAIAQAKKLGEIPGLVAEFALTDAKAEDLAGREVAKEFGAKDWGEFKGRSNWQNFVGFMRKRLDDQDAKAGAAGRVQKWARKAALGVGEAAAKSVLDVAIDEGGEWIGFDKSTDAGKAAVKMWESLTGEKHLDAKELQDLRIRNPEAFAKANRRQMNTPVALINELSDFGIGLGTIAAKGGEDVLKMVDILDGERQLLNADTGQFILGNMLEESMEMVEDPAKALRERPLSAVLDVATAPVGAIKAGARLSFAKRLKEATPGVKGYAKAAAALVPVPFTQTPVVGRGISKMLTTIPGDAELVAREAVAAQYAAALHRAQQSSRTFREFTKHAPDAPDEAVAAIKTTRLDKSSKLAEAKRLDGELRAAAQMDVAAKERFMRSFNEQPGADELFAALEFHESALRHQAQLQARAARGQKLSPAELNLAHAPDDPIKLLHMLRDPKFDSIFDKGVAGSARELGLLEQMLSMAQEGHSAEYLKALKSLTKRRERRGAVRARAVAEGKTAVVEKMDRDFAAHAAKVEELGKAVRYIDLKYIKQLEADVARARARVDMFAKVEEQLYSPEALKGHGAWLELDGEILGGANAGVAAVRHMLQGGDVEELAQRVKVLGDNPISVGVMERALEVVKFAAREEQVLVKAGVMTPAEAALNFGLRWNNLKDPLRAAKFEADGIALHPLAQLAETTVEANRIRLQQNVARHLTPESNFGVMVKDKELVVNGEKMQSFLGPDGVRLVQLPGKKGGSPHQRYGMHAGRVMELDTAEEIQRAVAVSNEFLDRIASLWSTNKVVNSFSSHVNALVGEGIVAASRGVDPLIDWPRALRMIAGGGTKEDKAIYRLAKERYGIDDGTSLRNLDEMGMDDLSKFTDVRIRSKEAFRLISETLYGGDTPRKTLRAERNQAIKDASWAGAQWWTDNIMGVGGSMKKAWDLRDKMNRVSLYERAWRRTARSKYGWTDGELSQPANFKRALEDEFVGAKALELAHEAALDYKALPRGPRITVNGRPWGLYEWMRKTLFQPFIAYGLKGTGFWSKEIVTRPLRSKAIMDAGTYTWEALEATERQEAMKGVTYGDRGWSIPVGEDNLLKVQYLQPSVNLPVDILRDYEKGQLSLGFLSSIMEAAQRKTANGKEIQNPVAYVIAENLASPTFIRVFGGGGTDRLGTVDKVFGRDVKGQLLGRYSDYDRAQLKLRDPVTGKEYNPRWEAVRLFLNLKDETRERGQQLFERAETKYQGALKRAQDDFRGADGKPGHNDMQRKLKDERDALRRLHQDTFKLASMFESR